MKGEELKFTSYNKEGKKPEHTLPLYPPMCDYDWRRQDLNLQDLEDLAHQCVSINKKIKILIQ